MTEDQIERVVEREMTNLDRLYMEGIIDQDEYDAAVKED